MNETGAMRPMRSLLMGLGGAAARLVAGNLGLALLYCATGKATLTLAVDPGFAAPVWPPAGLALAFLLRFGPAYVPGVFLGSFALNLWVAVEVLAPPSLGILGIAAAIAVGASAQALCCMFVVRRFLGWEPWTSPHERDPRLAAFVALAPVALAVSATVGTAALRFAGAITPGHIAYHWGTWWVGDALGTFMFAPLVLMWTLPASVAKRGHRAASTLFLGLAFGLVVAVWIVTQGWERSNHEATVRQRVDGMAATVERMLSCELTRLRAIADFLGAHDAPGAALFSRSVAGTLASSDAIDLVAWAPRATTGYSIALVEPGDKWPGLQGLDLLSRGDWRDAVERAARSGRARATAPVHVRVGREYSAAFFVAMPVRASGANQLGPQPAPPGQVRDERGSTGEIRGFVLARLAGRAFAPGAPRLAGDSPGIDMGIEVLLRDAAVPGPSGIIYDSQGAKGGEHGVPLAAPVPIEMEGRRWELLSFAGAMFVGRERTWQSWSILVAGAAFLALLAMVMLAITERASRVDRLVRQRTAELESSGRAIERQRIEVERTNADLAAALAAKGALLKELHHRVKNNLQVISSLLSLQARQLEDLRSRKILEESQNRVFSIALAHERLYRSPDLARIDFAEYARALVGNLESVLGARCSVTFDADVKAGTLGVESAIPCGLILNELVTNAFTHAYPEGRCGPVRVHLHESAAGRWEIAVEDEGVGLPASIQIGKDGSLGLELVALLAAQLGGALDVRRQGGTRFAVTFGRENEA